MRLSKAITAVATLAFSFMLAASSFAAELNPAVLRPAQSRFGTVFFDTDGLANIVNGRVVSVSDGNLVVRIANSQWTVETFGGTEVFLRNGMSIDTELISVGDRIDVTGDLDDDAVNLITADTILDRTIVVRAINGVVKSTSADTFVLDRNRLDNNPKDDIVVTIFDTTDFAIGTDMGQFSDLGVGMRVTAIGALSPRGSTMRAQAIDVSTVLPLPGTISSPSTIVPISSF